MLWKEKWQRSGIQKPEKVSDYFVAGGKQVIIFRVSLLIAGLGMCIEAIIWPYELLGGTASTGLELRNVWTFPLHFFYGIFMLSIAIIENFITYKESK